MQLAELCHQGQRGKGILIHEDAQLKSSELNFNLKRSRDVLNEDKHSLTVASCRPSTRQDSRATQPDNGDDILAAQDHYCN